MKHYFNVLEDDINKTCNVIKHLKDLSKQEYFEKTTEEFVLKIFVSIRKISKLIRKLEARNNEIESGSISQAQPKVDSRSKKYKNDDDKI